MSEELLTVEELADRLKVPAPWIYQRTRCRGRDRLPHMFVALLPARTGYMFSLVFGSYFSEEYLDFSSGSTFGFCESGAMPFHKQSCWICPSIRRRNDKAFQQGFVFNKSCAAIFHCLLENVRSAGVDEKRTTFRA